MSTGFFNDDMRFFIDHRFDVARYRRLLCGDEADGTEEVATFKAILGSIGEVCEDIERGARDHWHEEARLVDGRAVVPPHVADGYGKLRRAGLVCLPLSPEYGGYGLPILLNSFYLEMVARADSSLMTIVGLQTGVAGDIEKYGSEELKQRYLPRFASGELQGSMDLTESQAGSDLGGILTRVQQKDGRYFIDGEKIFITNGGADIHLVLARDGETMEKFRGSTNGLSLMLCPGVLPDGTPNGVRVARAETKIGIHGSPTCVVEFDHAQAFLLGERGEGFRAMLVLMNHARLGVAAQAIGVATAAYRKALEYAGQRLQFGLPIREQPLVKSMLSRMAIDIQAARALLYRTSALLDMTEALRVHLESERGAADSRRAELQQELEANTRLLRLLTPLCKFHATEVASAVTRKGIQLHGGNGYMAESPAAQYHADAIITTIYEGTSEIQASFALKEMSKGTFFAALETVRQDIEPLRAEFPELVDLVSTAVDKWITESMPFLMGDPRYALLNAKLVCEMVTDVVISGELLLQASVAPEKSDLAASFIHRHMLAVEMNARRIGSGDATRLERYDRILALSA